jgi:hypothetical protein
MYTTKYKVKKRSFYIVNDNKPKRNLIIIFFVFAFSNYIIIILLDWLEVISIHLYIERDSMNVLMLIQI